MSIKSGASAHVATSVADNSVDSDAYVDGSIDADHIASNAVTTAKINADAVTGAKIADDAIDSEHYTDGSIDTAHLAADAVDGTKLADNAVDSEHYTDGSIDSVHIASGTIAMDRTTLTAGTNISLSTNTLNVDDAFLINDGNDTTSGIITAAGFTLSEAASVSIGTPLLPSTDHTYSGMSAEMLAGGTIGAQDLVCIHTTTSEVVVADASAVGTARAIGIAPAAISDTATGTVLLQGFIRDDSWNWTTGGVLYNSETAGDLTQTAPTTDGAFVQVVGIALSPDVAYINPSLDIIEHA